MQGSSIKVNASDCRQLEVELFPCRKVHTNVIFELGTLGLYLYSVLSDPETREKVEREKVYLKLGTIQVECL